MAAEDTDFVARDKRPYGEAWGFFPTRVLLFAASWTLLTPVAILGSLLGLPAKLLLRQEKSKSIGGKKLSYPPVGHPLVEVTPREEREFDLCVYGATGYTGGLACIYLAKQYGKKIKWLIAGRRKDALERRKAELVALNPDLKDLAILQVDSGSDEQLQSMCVRSRVVVTTVGPFVNYGTPLVRAAIATKTDLCDITGEIDWVEGLIDNYDDQAREQGVKIISFCGHDSVPWDLSTYVLAKKLRDVGEELASVEFIDSSKGFLSGGTLESILEAPFQGYKTKNSPFPVWFRDDHGKESPFCLSDASHIRPYLSQTNQWTGAFIMSMVNSKVVQRSNALNGYGKSVIYKEQQAAESLTTVLGRYFELGALAPVLFLPSVIRRRLLPNPGEGPSEKELDEGFLQVTGIASGSKGSKYACRMYFRHHAGYRETARMLVETGLSIALSPDKCTRSSGILTPASCCADILLGRLLATGTELSFPTKL